MDILSSPDAWVALLTLTVLEIVLGIDNIVFIAIQTARLPVAVQQRARLTGLGLAMVMRIGLLFAISWLTGLDERLFTLFDHDFSWHDLILLGGGFFLLWKSTTEIHESIEGPESEATDGPPATFTGVIIQILLLDIVFSLDSVITAVGIADDLAVMVVAVVIAVGVMMFAAAPISAFVEKHPTVKMLGLSFLVLIGMSLVAEGFGQHIDKVYIYAAMGFSIFVEVLNLQVRKPTSKPVELSKGRGASRTRKPVETIANPVK